METWKDIKGYEGLYQVSNKGLVKNVIRNKIRPSFIDSKTGYARLILYNNCNKKNVLIHRLVAEVFIDNPENKATVNHIDGNKLNNNVENLEWATYKENIIHSYKTGLTNPDNPRNARLSESDVLNIMQLLKEGYKCIEISKMYNVNYPAISKIKQGKRWQHLKGLKP